jgi:hypothetical protein
MLANIVVHDRAHLGFRAIHKMGNIRFLSGVILGMPGGDKNHPAFPGRLLQPPASPRSSSRA